LAGAMCNFVAPIGVGLGPWAVVLVGRFAGGQYSGTLTLVVYVTDIVFGSMSLVLIAAAAFLLFFYEMHARANFMLRVARLAQRSAMLDVAENCLRDCLELCARYGNIAYAVEANARLVALLVQSGRMAEATPHEMAVRDVCTTQLTGWRGFLRTYVALEARRSLVGLAFFDDMADLGAACSDRTLCFMAGLHAGLQHADTAVAELEKAREMGLADDDVVVNDELFEVVRLEKPWEFAVLRDGIAENGRKRRRTRLRRRRLFMLIVIGLVGSSYLATQF
jgi:hypothetical protein